MKSCQNALKMQEVLERWDSSSFTISIASQIAKQIERHMEVTLSSCESQLHTCAVHSGPLLKHVCWHGGHHPPQEGLLCIWSKSCQVLPAKRSGHIPLCLSCFPYTCFTFGYPKNFAVLELEVHLSAYTALPKCLLASGKTKLHLFTFLNGRSPLETLSIRFAWLNP